MRKTKIVCTIGPASSSPEMLEKLIRSGMNAARLNFSHGDHEEHRENIERIRRISGKLGKTVAILQDLPGPKIRTGVLADPPVVLHPGRKFTFTTREIQGDNEQVALPYPTLVKQIKRNQLIYVDDAKLEFKACLLYTSPSPRDRS